jgi:hypothetical protein
MWATTLECKGLFMPCLEELKDYNPDENKKKDVKPKL